MQSTASHTLSRTECQALKGLAILSIVLHNMCHWTPLARGTNEFFFSPQAAINLRYYLQHLDWNFFIVLGSFFGQFGVQIFLFLSAYGLVLKYEQGSGVGTGRWEFISEHYLKLWRLMIIGLVAALTLGYFFQARCMIVAEHWPPMLLMIGNVLPKPDYRIFPGPYWFLGVMVEVYVIYRLCLMVKPTSAPWKRWAGPVAFCLATWIPQLLVDLSGSDGVITYLRYNFLIAGVPFSAGLLTARYVRMPSLSPWLWAVLTVACAAAFVTMQFCYGLWLWSSLFFVLAAVCLVRACGLRIMRPMVWVGTISSAAFIVHPIVRIFADNWMRGNHITDPVALHLMLLAYLAATLLVAVGYNRLIAHLPSPKRVTTYKQA